MKNTLFAPWLTKFQQQALAFNERRLIVLSGSHVWAKALLMSVNLIDDQCTCEHSCIIYGDNPIIPATIAKTRFSDVLGSESQYVIFSDSQFNADALAALSGTLIAGGILFLIINDEINDSQSFFMQRFFNIVQKMSSHVVIRENAFCLPDINCLPAPVDDVGMVNKLLYGCVTSEQVVAVEAIIKVLKGKRKSPLVLTADRGRGKSSALALACARLINEATKDNVLTIVVTAPTIGALSVFFKQLQTALPEGEFHDDCFISSLGKVEFIPVDQLIKTPRQVSLLLVDEAAGIPVYLLEALLTVYHRTVFASTVHGYEGAGRGFTLKFQKTLTDLCPKWRTLHIHQPIRYRDNDPLEQLIFKGCLLNATLEPLSLSDVKVIQENEPTFKKVTSEELIKDEILLAQVVSVLVTAHYQTKPSDIKMLLDNPNISLICLCAHFNQKETVIGVAMLMTEGQSDINPAAFGDIIAVKQSKRRLKSHFTPQSLMTQCGFEQAFDYKYIRVIRIAVHVCVQQQGIGQHLLQQVVHFAQSQQADFVSASFGVNKALLSFWHKQNFVVARLGFSKDKASGEHSALVLHALSKRAKTFEKHIVENFYRSFDYLLSDQYQHISPNLVALIYAACPANLLSQLTKLDLANVEAFSDGHRQYACCAYSLFLWLKHELVHTNISDINSVNILVSRLMQKKSVQGLCCEYGFSGKKAFEQALQKSILSSIK